MVGGYRHFGIERLADGVWAAIHATDPPAPAAWAVSNAVIVDLGGRTLLFDALSTTAAAAELRVAARDLTGRLPSILVYSHAHNDHTWGADQFPETVIVASATTRALMLAEGQAEVDRFREVAAERVAFWSGAGERDDPLARHDAPFFRPYWDGLAATLPALQLRYPDIGFDRRLDIHGQDRRVELVATQAAHTVGDVFMTVPDAGVVACGDLLFVGCHPFLADGDMAGLRRAITELEFTGAARFVPGHGAVGDATELRVLARYLDVVERAAADRDRGGEVAVPEPYREWALARFFRPNVEFCASGGRQAGPAADADAEATTG